MLPYTASKFALVGLSNGLRTELAKDGILVTTVIPSVVRTGSPRNALFKGQHRKEHAWFSIADSLPGVAMSAEHAAGLGLGAALASQTLLRRSRRFSFAGKAVLITGGSRGLGLVLARQEPRLFHVAWNRECLTSMQEACLRERHPGSDLVLWVHALLSPPVSNIERRRRENTMEELQKTQEYAAERERRRMQQPYEGEDRRKRARSSSPSTIPTPLGFR